MRKDTLKLLGSCLSLWGWACVAICLGYLLPAVSFFSGIGELGVVTQEGGSYQLLLYGQLPLSSQWAEFYLISVLGSIVMGKIGLIFIGTGQQVLWDAEREGERPQPPPDKNTNFLLWPFSRN